MIETQEKNFLKLLEEAARSNEMKRVNEEIHSNEAYDKTEPFFVHAFF